MQKVRFALLFALVGFDTYSPGSGRYGYGGASAYHDRGGYGAGHPELELLLLVRPETKVFKNFPILGSGGRRW